MQPSTKVRQGKAHSIRITPGGWLHKLAGTTEIAVNSLHNQGDGPAGAWPGGWRASRLTAPSRRCAWSPPQPARRMGFAVGVQWHPEYDWPTDIVSRRIFESFAAAVRDYIGQSLPPVLRIAAE